MAFRSYMLVGQSAGVEREEIVSLVQELEAMEEVIFAESVVGAFDLVAVVETDDPVEEVVKRIKTIPHVEDVIPLKVNPIPARERMWKNFDKIPSKPWA